MSPFQLIVLDQSFNSAPIYIIGSFQLVVLYRVFRYYWNVPVCSSVPIGTIGTIQQYRSNSTYWSNIKGFPVSRPPPPSQTFLTFGKIFFQDDPLILSKVYLFKVLKNGGQIRISQKIFGRRNKKNPNNCYFFQLGTSSMNSKLTGKGDDVVKKKHYIFRL